MRSKFKVVLFISDFFSWNVFNGILFKYYTCSRRTSEQKLYIAQCSYWSGAKKIYCILESMQFIVILWIRLWYTILILFIFENDEILRKMLFEVEVFHQMCITLYVIYFIERFKTNYLPSISILTPENTKNLHLFRIQLF